MTYTRYNASQAMIQNPQYGNNNIEKYLKEEIDFLLAPSANQLNGINFNDIYIPMPLAENFLSSTLKKSHSDKVLYLTGLTGSGKSMVLKKVFQFDHMTPKIHNNNLIIPFTFDGFSNGTISEGASVNHNIERTFQNMLDCACEIIEKTYSDIKRVQGNEEDFLDTVRKNRGDFTQIPDAWPRPSNDERILHFMKNNPIPFWTSVLKFYLNQDTCSINNVIILIDDVEGVGEKSELIPIKIAYKILTCLENTDRTRDWSSHLVISCRHYVYRLIVQNDSTLEYQHIETYPEPESLHLDQSLTVTKIVEKRYEAIKKKSKGNKWKNALQIVLEVISGIDNNVGAFLLNLKIQNMRKALSVTKRIVYNKLWIQRDYIESTAGAFTIDSVKDYNITQATLIRAIGMGESLIYHSDVSDIPNVMYNENERDLYPLLVLKYCLKNKSNEYATWEDTINLDYFYEAIKRIFGENNDFHFCKFKQSTEYLIIKRLLLRSIDQLQDNTIPVNSDTVGSITKVYISNAAVDIWDLLEKNSILFEMYTDDIWMDNSDRPANKKQFRGFDLDNYQAAINYLNILVEKEILLRNYAANLGKMDDYENLFGNDFICEHLLKGLINSLKAFYKEDAINSEFWDKIQILQKKVYICC